MMPTRICRDCQWHDPDTLECLHDKAKWPDPVTGEITIQTCYKMRMWPCGAEGKLFEPHPDVLASKTVDMTKEPF